MDVTRGFSRNFLSAIAFVEKSTNSALQFTQCLAASGDEALQREQVCKASLLKYKISKRHLLYSGRLSLQRLLLKQGPKSPPLFLADTTVSPLSTWQCYRFFVSRAHRDGLPTVSLENAIFLISDFQSENLCSESAVMCLQKAEFCRV